jgi:hypothetical protein
LRSLSRGAAPAHIPGDEGWPVIGRMLAVLADPKGEIERDPGNQRLHRKAARVKKFLIENRAVFDRAGQTVMAKIMENEKTAAA